MFLEIFWHLQSILSLEHFQKKITLIADVFAKKKDSEKRA